MTNSSNVFFLPYRKGSESFKNILVRMKRDGLNVKGIRSEDSKFKGTAEKVVVNWGNSGRDVPEEIFNAGRIVNHPEKTKVATNKLEFFQHAHSAITNPALLPRVPRFTQDKAVVAQWLEEGKVVFARTLLTSNSGKGIIEVTQPAQLDGIKDGTLFVLYVPKKSEWRIHVGFGEVFLRQRKAYRKPDNAGRGEITEVNVPEPNWRIRNHQNGYIFERNGEERPPADVDAQALKAVAHFGLDFGAVDVVYNRMRDKAYVLEINTAPGLENSTLADYSSMFTRGLELT